MLSLVCVTSSVEREPGGYDPEGETIVSITGLTLGGSEFAGHFVLYQKLL
jgi:hypothetical protein